MRGQETQGSAAPGAVSCSGATVLWASILGSPGPLCSPPQTRLHSAGCRVALPCAPRSWWEPRAWQEKGAGGAGLPGGA